MMNSHALRRFLVSLATLTATLMMLHPAEAAGTGYLFVSNERSNNILVFDPAKDYSVVKDIKTSRRPRDMHFNHDHSLLYVACGEDDVIDVIDVATLEVVDHIPTARSPEMFVLNKDETDLYVSNEENSTVQIISIKDKIIVNEIPTGAEPEGVILSEDEKTLYATSEVADMVHVIDTDSGSVVDNVIVGTRPRRFVLTKDGKELWVSDELSGEVSIIDRATNQVIDTLTFGLCGGGPEGMVNPFKRAANIDFDLRASFDPTVNLGVLWEPKSWFALGLVYQGGARTTYTGSYMFHSDPMLRSFVRGLNSSLLGPIVGAVTGMPQEIPEYQSGNMTARIPFPWRVQAGMKLMLTDYVQLNADVSYADWAQWNELTFQFDRSVKLLEMARLFGYANSSQATFKMGFRSVVNYSLGTQLNLTKKLALRFGYEPRKSSIPGDKMSLLAPLPDTKLKSVGLRYRFDDGGEVNLTASYMKGTYNIPARSDCNLNCDNFFNLIYNPYAATNVSGSLIVKYAGASYTRPF